MRKKHIGQEIRDDGPKSHYSKAGTPTMGGIIFIISTLITVIVFRLFNSEVLLAIYGMIAFGAIGFIDDFMKLVMIMAMYGLSLYLIILGFVYMIEVLSVIIQMTSYKLRNKKRVFLMSPIHHHYELKGYKEQKIVSTFMVVSVITSLITLLDIL
ncbi:MAG: hypothetical protein E6162_08940 [Finegoldia magna]|uniref:hypothetical protein n=1 Tax=Finegoldia magna TaxID=1260 RepID=UPI00290B2052|nr:hypothetical protein [Finegoldia magna]MDU5273301.1 hypothetical protein [Finegoldia magna]